MTNTSSLRVQVYQGIPAAGSSMPTCGVCHRQIKLGQQYAGVLYEPIWKPIPGEAGPRREVRHLEECADWKADKGTNLRDGDQIWTHRYALTDWGPRIRAVVVNRTDEFDERGWRAVWLAPADPTSSLPVDELRALGEEWAVKLADKIGTVDPLPTRVWMSDDELVHYKRPEENSTMSNTSNPLRAQTGPAIANWLKDEPLLLARARQVIGQDERDSSGLFPMWVEFLLFGRPWGNFNLNTEPEHNPQVVMNLKMVIDRDDFRSLDWDAVREAVSEQ